MNYQDRLINLAPTTDFFVGIDSDGCVFDTMEVKQKEFFIPNGIKYFNLFPLSKIVRETWEFVNLYSKFRGVNRFPALVNVFELLSEREDIKSRDYKLPDISALKRWIEIETKLGNESLEAYLDDHPDRFLSTVLEWSLAINSDIGQWLKGVTPFNFAVASLERINQNADSIVVSQTPLEALEREWKEHGIEHLVHIIAGQEYGTKSEHIALAAKGKYSDNNILMIGDAIGDLKAASENGVLFYPIVPGNENGSWEKFYNEAFDRFLDGTYKGLYESELLIEFNRALPGSPHWDQV